MRHTHNLKWGKLGVGMLPLIATVSILAQGGVVRDQFGTEYDPSLVSAPSLPQGNYPAASPSRTQAPGGGVYLQPQTAALSNEVLVGRLDGIVLVPRPGDVIPSGVPGVRGIWHDLNEFPPKVGNALNAYIGGPVSLASLDQMVRDTINAYRSSDRPVVDVLVPEQDITSGVVQLVVVEGTLGTIRVQGASREEEAHLRKSISARKGEPLRSSVLLSDLAWMNRSPYRRVDLVYAPGYEYGQTDLILRTNEIDPFSIYAGYENSGNELLGEDRLIFGASWNEAWGPDRTLSYQLTTDIEFETLTSHSLVYGLPLPWRHYFTFLGAYVTSEATIDTAGVPLNVNGESWQLSGRYALPIRLAPDNVSHEFEFGMDFKSSNNDLEFGGENFFDATTHIYQLSAGYNALIQDKTGATRVDLTGYVGLDGVDDDNNARTFQQSRAGAEPQYVYLSMGAERSQNFIWDTMLRFKAQGQISNENLLASEQLGVGGPSTVRGYPTSIARGDEGVLLTAEWYSPLYSLGDWFNWRTTKDELRFLLFGDFATVSNTDELPGEMPNQQLMGFGAGLRWNLDEWLRIRADFAVPVGFALEDEESVDNFRVHLGATATF